MIWKNRDNKKTKSENLDTVKSGKKRKNKYNIKNSYTISINSYSFSELYFSQL